MRGELHKKGGLAWKKRFFVLDETQGSERIVYYLKEGDEKVRGELPLNAESRTSDLPNKKSELERSVTSCGRLIDCCCGGFG